MPNDKTGAGRFVATISGTLGLVAMTLFVGLRTPAQAQAPGAIKQSPASPPNQIRNPAQQVPADQAPIKRPPGLQVPAQQIPCASNGPAQQAPSQQVPSDQAPGKQGPAIDKCKPQ